MKKIFLLFSLIIFGCNSSKKITFGDLTYTRNYSHWVGDFKDRILCNCILSGVESKDITQKVLEIDKSFYNEIDIVLREDIKNIIRPVILKMKRDSLQSLTNVGEGAAGKLVFDTCIKFYKSKELNAIAKVELKKWKKLNIDSLRSVLNPTY